MILLLRLLLIELEIGQALARIHNIEQQGNYRGRGRGNRSKGRGREFNNYRGSYRGRGNWQGNYSQRGDSERGGRGGGQHQGIFSTLF